MQCKDIPEIPILEALKKLNGRWAVHWKGEWENTIYYAFPSWVNDKLVLAKLKKMKNKGLIDGCPCGCRGDWVLTEKGKQVISSE